MTELASLSSKRSILRGIPIPYLVFGMLFVLALGLRVALYPLLTGDYTFFVSQWYDFIQSHGGFAAMKYNFSNYNPPYLYLLAVATYLPIPKLVAIKSISVVFDVVLALFTYLILRLKYEHSYIPIIGAIVMLFAPTVVINSSAWGQCDAIYAAFCLGSLYFLLKKRPAWACVFFGVAIAFKLQAIFFLPVLLMFVLKRTLPLRYLILIPAVFLALLVPSYLAGRDVGSLLTVYTEQMNTGGVGAGVTQTPNGQARPMNGNGMPQFDNRNGQPSANAGSPPVRPQNGFGGTPGGRPGAGFGQFSFTSLTYNAPTIYQWLDGTAFANNKWVGIGLAALAIALLGGLLLVTKTSLTSRVIMDISLVCALTIPFLLPEMHERYFYLADVISIVYAFSFPRSFYVAIIMQLISLLSYAPYLLNIEIMSLWYVSFAVLGLVLVAWVRLVYSSRRELSIQSQALRTES